MWKERMISFGICIILCVGSVLILSDSAKAEDIEPNREVKEEQGVVNVDSKSVILTEMSTGNVIYEKDADLQLAPASVTKIMTMLLIFDAIHEGKLSLEDEVTVSEYAASMGGSQIFLEVGEKQNVDTMIKAIAVSSANDACVAMAEYIAGTEEAFVESMNSRADGLGMVNTKFMNCNGLDSEGHVTTARDISLMSRELMVNYPEITNYTMIWMENITHVTAKGSTEFGLSNTNKLVKQYPYTTGLKTGFTDSAKYCISATANHNDLDLNAVIMGADTIADRTQDATKLLNYGFSTCQKYEDQENHVYQDIPVRQGVKGCVTGATNQTFSYVDTSQNNLEDIQIRVVYDKTLSAPIEKGVAVGKVIYELNEKNIGENVILSTEKIEKMNMLYAIKNIINEYLFVVNE